MISIMRIYQKGGKMIKENKVFYVNKEYLEVCIEECKCECGCVSKCINEFTAVR